MNFGLMLPFQNPARWALPFADFYREQIEQVVLAEELGYDTIWLTEHHFDDDGWSPSLLPLAAGIATRTSRIRIGTLVTSNTFRHPVVLLKQAVTVDHISEGRLILGLGAGWNEDEHRRYGIDLPAPADRVSRLEEALEIIDRRTIAAVEASVYAAGLPADAGAVLIIELDGAAVSLPAQVERVRQISARAGAAQVEVAADESERQRFWRARKGAFGAMGRLAPDLYVHDAVVPRSKLPEVLDEICAIGDRHGLTLSNVFHAGDGNLHPNISFDRRDPDVLARVLAAGAEILECCVRAGGVITGEHGVGNEKREFLHLVFSDADMDAMKRFRACFDPDGVCNPGKIFPTTRFCVESNPKSRGYDRVPFE